MRRVASLIWIAALAASPGSAGALSLGDDASRRPSATDSAVSAGRRATGGGLALPEVRDAIAGSAPLLIVFEDKKGDRRGKVRPCGSLVPSPLLVGFGPPAVVRRACPRALDHALDESALGRGGHPSTAPPAA